MPSLRDKHKNFEGLFLFVMRKSNGHCWYCGEKKWHSKRPLDSRNIAIDHVIARSRGGSDHLDNLVPCCAPCNGSKAARTLEDFRRVAAQRALGMPVFSFEQIEWIRERGVDLSAYDSFKFWFETATQCSSGALSNRRRYGKGSKRAQTVKTDDLGYGNNPAGTET